MEVIIQQLKLMASTYQLAIDDHLKDVDDYQARLEARGIGAGMCYYIESNIDCIRLALALKLALLSDAVKYSKKDFYWYKPPFVCSSSDFIIKQSLQPRLDNINRTIARLEKQPQLQN